MKKLAITLLSVAAATTMYGQGNFNFNNLNATGTIKVGAPSAPGEGNPGFFVGTGYTASLYWGAASSTMFSQLTYFPIVGGDPKFFGAGVADPDQSAFAGLFDGGNVTIPSGAGNGVTIQVGVAVWWSGPGASGVATSYAQALADGYNTGLSGIIPIVMTTTADPSVIQDLTALPSVQISQAPEPTTLAFCGLGAAALLLFRRRK
jgi:hypothetical protein